MYEVIRRTEPKPGASRTVLFQGNEHGSEVSFFLVDNDPGQGPGLHVHPYTETWVVRSGEAEFTVGREKTRATAGDIVVGAANIPHKFVNVGTGRLEIVCIHANDRVVQEFLEEANA
ncbi:cupin domain-containing protein [Mesorhizobium sp. DCY119]|jgi:quercetin dioxygenase-like cupin family protein|uniref:cupin domain-containing protein n=1 Tax=Mesorhizobium sp. DCY119 TaxID=2108445 RepID=UPI000E6B586A|nr:cupin domain-containing protein [Mesorhizobium sp. DCY119]RJG43622.1 cupin domain-containing protein [Mesorhizobium sp. DCY119]